MEMDVDSLFKVPLKRHSSDFCFYGPKGSGKTIAASYFGLYCFLHGTSVASNYHLNFPHQYIETVDQFKEMRNTCFLADDFEKWASSKFIGNKDKKDLLECILNFGKAGVSPFIWTTKRPMEIDKTIRACGIDYFVKCMLRLKYEPSTLGEYEKMSGYLDAHVVNMEVYRAFDLQLDRVCILDDLDVWCLLYDTQEKIEDIRTSFRQNRDGRQELSPMGQF